MSLLGLPTEALSQIFRHVGPEYFHQDIRRLTVSWHWFKLAYRECYYHIELSGRTVGLLTALLPESSQAIESAFHIARKLTLRIDEPAKHITRKRMLLLAEPATNIPAASAMNVNRCEGVLLPDNRSRQSRNKSQTIYATTPAMP